jgi:Cell wall-active antibiotics response LiaF, C-terminal
MIAVFGGTSRRGRWVPARRNTAIGILGGVQLDFREAMLGPGVTEVAVFACMGGVEIIVPPEMAVEVDGMAIMGGFDHETDTVLNRDPDQPLLRVKGLVVMGGVEIAVRRPGESKRDAKKRKRIERRELRELKSDWDG